MSCSVASAVLSLLLDFQIFAIQSGAALTALDRGLMRSRAVLVISPHWETQVATVSTALGAAGIGAQPRAIHRSITEQVIAMDSYASDRRNNNIPILGLQTPIPLGSHDVSQ